MQNDEQRGGFSAMETVVAFVLLGVIVTSIGKFAAYVDRGVQDRQLALRLQWEVENAREVIGSWPVSEVTPARIEQLDISAELTEILEQPRWNATVQPQLLTGKPNNDQIRPNDAAPTGQAASVEATTVHLQLQAGYRGQQIKPVELVFWVLPQQTAETTSKPASVDSRPSDSTRGAETSGAETSGEAATAVEETR